MNLFIKRTYTSIEAIRAILFILIVLLASSFNIFNLSGRNLLLISFVPILILILLDLRYRSLIGWKKPAVFILAGYMFVSFLINYSEARVSSFLYSLFFIFLFWILSTFSNRYLTPYHFKKLLLFLIGAYLTITIIGHLFVLVGLFSPISANEEGVIHSWFGTLQENGVFRYYSLSTEPSYAAIIVVLLLSQYLDITEKYNSKGKSYWVYFAVIYMLIMFNSGYGFLLIGVLLLMKINWKRTSYILTTLLILFLSIIIITQYRSKINSVDRLVRIYEQFDYEDITSIREIDHSASFRILPFYYYFEKIKLNDLHFYFGYGAAESDTFLSDKLFPHLKQEIKFLGGFLPAYIIDYGIVGLFFFGLFYHTYINTYLSFDFFLFISMLTNASFNTQLFWLVIIVLYLKRMLIKRSDLMHDGDFLAKV